MIKLYRPILVFLPVILFACYIFKHAVNVPYMDDMELIDSVNILKNDLSRFFSVLVRQQNDHRSAFPRIGIFLTYLVKGTLDFKMTIMFGYLYLMLLGYTFYLIFRTSGNGFLSFLPVTLLLFSPMVYQVHMWSLTALQHTPSIAFSLLCLYFLREEKRKVWYYSILFAVMASLTNLDGISIIPVAIVWLMTQKRWKHAAFFLVFGVAYLIIYFADFKFTSDSKLIFNAETLVSMAKGFVVGTGSIGKVISDTRAVPISLLIGSVILAVFVTLKLFPNIAARSDRFETGNLLALDFTDICFLRLLASMAFIAIGRQASGAESMVAIRYQIYSVSMLILFYLFVIKYLKNRDLRIFKALFLFVSFLLNVYSYAKYESAVSSFEHGLKADSYNYPRHRVFLHQYLNMTDADPEFYVNYTFPVYFYKSIIESWKRKPVGEPANATISIQRFSAGELSTNPVFPVQIIGIENKDKDLAKEDVYLGLTSSTDPQDFYLVALHSNRAIFSNMFSKGSDRVNYYCEIPEKLRHGTYLARFCWLADGKPMSRGISKPLIF
ncbi:hypothetical protein [Dyadobacter sp. CY323]|uniref:hypothetical protein n=1 Tax=Dyadobacter sp. CY323 TaxID=2907302 RepID=UPI001F2E9BDA|nr:hypothetical protein [Dyadobacter sp. CY323]MCE6990572.1 hypothetical protein [Dyadobacter sp. CY323]